MTRFRYWLGRNLGTLVIGFALVALTVTAVLTVIQVYQAQDERAQLCEFVDAEHNQDRKAIVQGERELYTKYAQDFSTFIDTPRKRRAIHRNNRRAYYRVRMTRPEYCSGVRDNPVPAYPPQRDFVREQVTVRLLQALNPPKRPPEQLKRDLRKKQRQEQGATETPAQPAPSAPGTSTPQDKRLARQATTREPREVPMPSSEPEQHAPDAEPPSPQLPAPDPTPPPADGNACVTLPADTSVCLPTP